MAADGNQAQKENNNNFGLPKATFKPIEPTGSSNWLRITAIIAIMVLIIGAGVVYWLFKRSSSSYNDFISKTLKKQQLEEELIRDVSEEDLEDELLEAPEQQAIDFIEDFRKDELAQENPSASTTKGAIAQIQHPQGLYYIIVASYIDKDLAMDYGKKLLKEHPYIALLAPTKGKHFYRLAIEQGATLEEAKYKAATLKADFGDQLWILKY